MSSESLTSSKPFTVIGLYSYAVKHYEKVLELAEKVESVVSVVCYSKVRRLSIAGAYFGSRGSPQPLFDICTNRSCFFGGPAIPSMAVHLIIVTISMYASPALYEYETLYILQL